ncbi:hypothetical protein CU103_00920 [Phyllobacterium sophorae]|uniref:Uncharacterized protein n=1 Tax=Phyllobacterium sophorae TaxID=1520277 RepID=A0A2P7BKK6_9HYPH|nr:hypothetical protein CU103_00920 [Phyllobacterium sophorae]
MESIRRLVAVSEITRHRITSFSFVEHEIRMGCLSLRFKRKIWLGFQTACKWLIAAISQANDFS